MPDLVADGTEGQEPAEVATDTTDTTAETAAADTAAVTDTTSDRWAGIPEEWAWAKNAVESANREAASRRVALRELEERVKDAKTPEEFNAALADVKAKEVELTNQLARERAARKHRLNDDLLEFLTADTEEGIEAQAEKLAALKPEAAAPVVITKLPPTGGAKPSETSLPESGKDAWAEYRKKNRR